MFVYGLPSTKLVWHRLHLPQVVNQTIRGHRLHLPQVINQTIRGTFVESFSRVIINSATTHRSWKPRALGCGESRLGAVGWGNKE
ncbi:hypothetical protein WN944_005928 [Citrus x changshan-huyou]|uniref:Uncharacterized protein n=1 Tax=Citrus x changshan-huyou TaxID=2935761 RepID=A0AAP0MK45_9ROSI